MLPQAWLYLLEHHTEIDNVQPVGEPSVVPSPVVLDNRDYWKLLAPVVDRGEDTFVSTQVGAVD